jgi:hypothetical protein
MMPFSTVDRPTVIGIIVGCWRQLYNLSRFTSTAGVIDALATCMKPFVDSAVGGSIPGLKSWPISQLSGFP